MSPSSTASVREWRAAHPEQAKALNRRHTKAYRESHPERAKAAVRVWQQSHQDRIRLLAQCRRLGVTVEWFRNQLVGQAGRCAICGNVMKPGRGTQIDHDHRTNKPRGLLCGSCNLMLGFARDSAGILNAAITYLKGTSDDVPE